MTAETFKWLAENVLIGFAKKHSNAWWYDYAPKMSNHFDGAVPMDRVRSLLAWEPATSPLFIPNPNPGPDAPEYIAVPDRKLVYRPNATTFTPFGIFTENYTADGFGKWLIEGPERLLDRDLQVGSCGLLKGGAVAWLQIEMAETMETSGGTGVHFSPFITAYSSLDGTLGTGYKNGVTRVECDNTLSMNLRESGSAWKVKRTKNMGLRISEAREALDIMLAQADEFDAEVKKMCETTVTDAQWNLFLDMVASPKDPTSKRGVTLADQKRDGLSLLWTSDMRVSPYKNTLFGVWQATNTYNQHERTVKGADRFERNQLNMLEGKVEAEDRETLTIMEKILAAA